MNPHVLLQLFPDKILIANLFFSTINVSVTETANPRIGKKACTNILRVLKLNKKHKLFTYEK